MIKDACMEALEACEGKVLVIDFWAPWCMPCLMYKHVFKKVAEKYSNDPRVEFIAVNVDECPELARKFAVMSIPTTIVLVNCKVFDGAVGFIDEETLDSMVGRALEQL